MEAACLIITEFDYGFIVVESYISSATLVGF